MELLYNPDAMSEQEIKATFVARQPLVDELIALVERQPDGPGMQHVVIIAPRGMGKTTVLLMVKFALKDRGLADRWQALKFPEESYGVYDLADFWLTVLNLLASETSDDALRQQADDLRRKYPKNEDLQEAALAAIQDWRRTHGKRLVLLVENFDLILEQINDEQDNTRLRDVLLSDGTMMLIGGATKYFNDARANGQLLSDLFQLCDLSDLQFNQIQDLLRRRATADGMENFDTTLQANASRLRALEYFTGGNPRLVLMLYRVVTQSDLSEVRRGLAKLLDEVTPYYKAKIEALPPQQRKILDHIARVSGVTNEGLTPGDIATAVRLPPNQVSAQLKRLAEIDYVRSANLPGRSSYYTLAEPLYAIWHQMRLGRNAHQRMGWLVNFLRVWYAAEEMGAESERLQTRFHAYLEANRLREARDTLEHYRYLAEAMPVGLPRTRAVEDVIRGHLALGDAEPITKELLASIKLTDLSAEMLEQLQASRAITEVEKQKALSIAAYEAGQMEEALPHVDRFLALNPQDAVARSVRGLVLGNLGRGDEALASFAHALTLDPKNANTWALRGITLSNLGRDDEALVNYDRSLTLTPGDANVWALRGAVLSNLGRDDEALASYDHTLALRPEDTAAWYTRGVMLGKLGRQEEALASYDRALTLTPEDADGWYNRGIVYRNKFVTFVEQNDLDAARQAWTEALSSGQRSGNAEWPNLVSLALLFVAEMGQLELARQLISESALEEQLFPLARALDYLHSGDEALIEKLSPEVKDIVEKVVARLRPATKEKKTRKEKPRTRRGKKG